MSLFKASTLHFSCRVACKKLQHQIQKFGRPKSRLTFPLPSSSFLVLYFLLSLSCATVCCSLSSTLLWLQICLALHMMRPAATVACLRAVLISCDLTQPTCRLVLFCSPLLNPPASGVVALLSEHATLCARNNYATLKRTRKIRPTVPVSRESCVSLFHVVFYQVKSTEIATLGHILC